ncbi:MAG: metallophosphoesterase, partial [Phycisphaerae bacterium]|nr:metallophosphoesterase [Phycisphaerae bacterium]
MKRVLATTKTKVLIGLLCLSGLQMLATSANAASFHFTVTSDQLDEGNPTFGRVLDSINSVVDGPGIFHVSVGDIDYANGTNRALINSKFGADFPWFGVVGNHDADDGTDGDMIWLRKEFNDGHDDTRTPLKDIFPPTNPGPAGSTETTYSWDYANAHFIVLNCYWDGTTGQYADSHNHMTPDYDMCGNIEPNLLSWLQADLAATNKPFIFIFVHEPAFPYNHHYGDSLDAHPAERDAFWSLLESEKVTAVFTGHLHYYFKHRGGGGPQAEGYPGHTYNYPEHDSWRTQDPNIDSLYGTVWQISTGNAGKVPGGITAGPTLADNLPDSLQWNGVTFIDVVVDEDNATINVYRDERDGRVTQDPPLGTLFSLADTITVSGDFLAYNDCVYDPGLVAYGTDPCGNTVHYGDTSRITTYGIGIVDTAQQPPGVGYSASSGELIDYTTGAGTGVIATLTESGGVNWQPMVDCTEVDNCWTGGYDTAYGTDAYNIFHDIADMTGCIYYGSAGWYVDVDFTGLNPSKSYTFATSASRARSTTNGEPGYTDRWTIYTISGIDAATNASSVGTTEYLGDPWRVRFNTGNNHNEGYVAKWTGIHPGTDGSFKVRAEAAPDANAGYKAYSFDVFMLQEEPMVPDDDPPTPDPMTWASLPTATSPTSIIMTATTAIDPNYPPVKYYFECTTDASKSSDWQTSTTYAASGLIPSTLYSFRVKARDNAPVPNETEWSGTQSATTLENAYLTKFIQMAGWLATQQATNGGIWEGEDYTSVVETDNTTEAIWIWSRYAELTGDYTTYQTRINNAWTYCNNNPSWLEGGALTSPLPYYSTYNIGWGLLAEMKYRQVYLGKSGYVDHTSYGTSCANALVSYNPSTTATTDVLVTGIAAGALYQYGVNVGNTSYQNRAVTLGGNVRTWLNSSTSRFASESWAVSGGVAVWGVLNSYYKVYSGGDTWAATANTYMPLNASNSVNNDYEYGHDGWYAWGHYAVSEYLGSSSFTKYQNIIDLLITSDGDNDGGIRQGPTFGNGSDYAWSTNCMQFAANLILTDIDYYTISGTITTDGSPLAGVTMNGLPGNPVTDANGFYIAGVVSGWSGTVTPTKSNYTFTPTSRPYSNVTADQTGQNYTATYSSTAEVVYDFSSGAGTKHYAWGTYTDDWASDVEGQRRKTPEVGTQVTSVMADAYTRLANSDNSRYTNPDEGFGDESTFIAEFNIDENPEDVEQIDVLWEGYGNASHHMELYVWDYVQGNWGNGQGSYGNNNFMDDGSGTSDFVLSGSITQNVSRYINPTTGQITILVYDDVASEASNHDYISVTVHVQTTPPPGKATSPSPGSGTVNVSLTPTLSWTAGTGATSHIVYFGTDSTPDSSEL